MKSKLFFIILLLLTCISIAQAENRLDIVDDKVIAETDAYLVHLHKGTIVYLHNKLTNETYTIPEPTHEHLYNAFWFPGKTGHEAIVYARDFRLEKIEPLKVHMVYEKNGVRLIDIVSIDANTGDLIFQQDIVSEEPIGAEIGWYINDLDTTILETIVPANDGISLDNNTSTDSIRIFYPSLTWEAQLIICQSLKGGFSVWTEDADFQFKSFSYKREKDFFRLEFIFINDASLDNIHGIKSVEWRINTYNGGWRVPARQYRDWMERTFSPHQPPEWAKEINTMIQVGNNYETIRLLAENGVDPKKTLLAGVAIDEAIAGDGINYTIKPGYARLVEEAHKYGFKFCVVASKFGVFKFDTPIYERFKKHWMIFPHGEGGPSFVGSGGSYQIFINPASAEYRQFMVEQLRRVYETAPCDGFFFDASNIVVNHAYGKIDGLRMPQGSVRLAQEVREAIPGTVFIGSGLHEVTYTYQNFSVHFDPPPEGANPHPINTFLFRPYVKGFVKLRNETINGFRTSPEMLYVYKTRGTLPDIHWWHGGVLEEQEGQKWLSVLKEWQRLSPQINFESDIPYQPHWTDIFQMPTIGVPADVNGDMVVNILDLVAVADHFGTTDPRYDVNYDGVVNILDLVIVSQEMSSQ